MSELKPYQFEVCANSVASCLAAQAGGAHRVELCAALPEGGTTPSAGEITVARELLQIKLHIIIRPRGGDFLYSSLELKSMLADIRLARQLGVDGVVLGCLTPTGAVDVSAMEQLMAAATGLSVTFHRAFDLCRDPHQSLEQLIELGCHRLLTSGQQPTAEQGIPLLKTLQEQAAGRITLLAGSGIQEANIARIASETAIREFHFSARSTLQSEMRYRNEAVSMGGTLPLDEYERSVTTAERVRNTISAVS